MSRLDDLRLKILTNICYTELVYGRINKKLGMQKQQNEIEQMIIGIINDLDSKIEKRGKNFYITLKNKRITINSFTYRVITMDNLI